MMNFLILVLIVIAAGALIGLLIFLLTIMPGKMCEVAELKGYDYKQKHIFAICFWFGIFGFLYVIGLPDLKQRKIFLESLKNNEKSENTADASD